MCNQRGAEWLYDAGDSMISLEHVRAVIDKPPWIMAGKQPVVWFGGRGRIGARVV